MRVDIIRECVEKKGEERLQPKPRVSKELFIFFRGHRVECHKHVVEGENGCVGGWRDFHA